ncbi:MAG: M3 family metallopeptidase, partial [Pseudomonadota bacterium]
MTFFFKAAKGVPARRGTDRPRHGVPMSVAAWVALGLGGAFLIGGTSLAAASPLSVGPLYEDEGGGQTVDPDAVAPPAEPAVSDPASDPAAPKPDKTEPAAAEPAKTEPAEPEDPNTWDLTKIFKTPEAWAEAAAALPAEIDSLTELEEGFTASASSVAAGLDRISAVARAVIDVYIYASLDYDTNVTDPARQAEAQSLYTRFQTKTSFVDPALLDLGAETLSAFIAAEPGLTVHDVMLKRLVRRAAHTLSEPEETIMARASDLRRIPRNVYEILSTGNMPWPEVTLSTGDTVRLDSVGYGRYRASPVRADRELVFQTFWSLYAEYEGTFGSLMASKVASTLFDTETRAYDSALSKALFNEAIPPGVYDTLIAEVRAGLPLLHRAFKIRARMLGVDDLQYHDIYPPLVSLDRTYPIEETKKLVLDGLAPLGADYGADLDTFDDQRWMHVLPTEGKRSGAYMNQWAYDAHPYILLNHTGTYNSVMTYAHEWGHAMHSVYTKRAQPWEKIDYATFIA